MSTLATYVRSLLPSITQENLLEDCRILTAEIEKSVLPPYKESLKLFKSWSYRSDRIKELAKTFDGVFGKSTMVPKIHDCMERILEVQHIAEDRIQSMFQRDIISEGLTVLQANLIKTVELNTFISRFSLQLLNYIYVEEAQTFKEADADYPLTKLEVKYIADNFMAFCYALSVMSKSKSQYEEALKQMPDRIMGIEGADLIETSLGEKKVNPLSAGFIDLIGDFRNPIYHISMLVAEYQAKRYRRNKDAARILKLRLLELESLRSQEPGIPNLERDIAITQERLDATNFDILEMENSL